MKIIKFLLILVICIKQEASAQKVNIMATYTHTELINSPGFEVNYFFNDKVGVELGLSALFFNYKPNQMANQAGINEYNTLFYNGNLGLCGFFFNYKQLKVGWTGGVKLYYGPEFIPLHYYEQEGYYIYFDSSGTDLVGNKFDVGLDAGILLYVKKLILGIKYDTARGQTRYLVGWSFSLSKHFQKNLSKLDSF